MGGRGGGSGVGGGGGGSGAAARVNHVNSGVPGTARKVVQSLKEVVNCSEQEIYAMLVECDMDPDEAVNRLLSQDTFHEVKSKRDKKKETKDTTDSWPRGAVNSPNRGTRGGSDRYAGYAGRGGANQFSSNESGSLLGRPANKGENGARTHLGGLSSTAGVIGRQLPWHIDHTGAENKRLPMSSGDAVPSSQASSGYQSAWLGAPGHRSMADIVKMGRPLHPNVVSPLSSEPFSSSKEIGSTTTGQKAPFKEEWPSIEKPEATYASAFKGSAESKLYTDPFSEPAARTDHHLKSQLDEDPVTENLPVESPVGDQVRPASVSSRNLVDDDSGGSSLYEDSNYRNIDSYQTHRHPFEHNGAEDATSSVATNFQLLLVDNDDREGLVEEDKPTVIIPNHLQVHTSDCLHLQFGSFGSGIRSGLPSASPSGALNDSLEEIPEIAEDSSIRHPDARDAEFYGDDEPLRNAADENMAYQIDSNARNYESSSDSETEPSKEDTLEAAQENQYNFSSTPDYAFENRQQNYAFENSQQNYAFENSQQLNPPSAPKETAPQMQNINTFPNAMQAYTSSLPSTLLPSAIQNVREPELQYSPFPVVESMPPKFSNAATSLASPAISMAEALRAASISMPQPTQQTMPGATAAAGPAALAQHLAMHPYTQPTLPLGHYANMIGYPFLPQSYTYMPSTFQQAFAGNSTYQQSLAAMLPQYKNNNLPQSASVPSAYGFGGTSSNLPGGNFPLNPSSAANSTISYEDVLNSQYKDSNHLASLQQNENSPAWLQGPNSRMLSGVPGSTYYSFPGQNQQPPGFRQGQQQPSQHFGALGYANLYHSQAGISLDHHQHHHLQQQNPRDMALPQGHPSKPTQQLWQNSY